MTRPLALVLLTVTACQPGVSPISVSSDDPVPAQVPFAPAPDCRIVDSSEWAAWIDAMPGPGKQATLMVSGKLRVRTGGHRVHFSDLRIAESHPVQIFLDLVVTPPSGPATQAITTVDVRGEWPVPLPVGSVTIRCGRQVIGRIDEIVTAL